MVDRSPRFLDRFRAAPIRTRVTSFLVWSWMEPSAPSFFFGASRAAPLIAPFTALLALDGMAWDPVACSLCAQGLAVELPGSRPHFLATQESAVHA